MDFDSLKRKELQALCKKHGIPANLKNLEMKNRLSALLKEENPTKRGRSCLKNLGVVGDGDEQVSGSKAPKRVKFSPENETFIFEKTDPREMRLRARKCRAFGNSKMEENPVSVGGNLGDMVSESVDEMQKPTGRISRRKSVLIKPSAVSDTEKVDHVDKPFERILRRRSVLVKSDALLDSKFSDNVEKCAEKNVEKTCAEVGNLKGNLRSRGLQKNVEDMLLSPCVENKAKRRVVGRGAVKEVNWPQDELLKELKSAEMVLEISGKDDDGVGTLQRCNVAGTGKAMRPVRQQKNAKARGHASVSKVNRNDEVLDQAVEMVPNIKKENRGIKKLTPLKKQEVTEARAIIAKDLGKGNDGATKISESEGAKQIGLRKRSHNRDKDVGLKETKVVRRSQRQAGISKVGFSSTEQVIDDGSVRGSVNHLAMDDHAMVSQCINGWEAIGCSTDNPLLVGTDYVLEKEIIVGASTSTPSLSERREPKVDDLCQATTCSSSAEKIADNTKEAIECSSNSSEKPYGTKSIMQLHDRPEAMDITDKVPENAVAVGETPANNEFSMLHNSAVGEAENSMQSTKVAEASNLNDVADQTSYEETEFTPPSIRRQFSGTLCGSRAEQTRVGAAEPICIKSSNAVGGFSKDQLSSSFAKLRSEMRKGETFEQYNQIHSEDLNELENRCKVSPSLSNLAKDENMLDSVAMNAKKSDVQPAMQEDSHGSMGSADTKFKEVEQIISTFTVEKGSSHILSDKKVVLGPVVSMEAADQSPIVLERQTLFSNVSAATINYTMKEGEYIKIVTPLQNRRTDPISSDTEDSNLVQSLNKDGSVAKTEPSSFNSFISYLESRVDGAIKAISVSMKEQEEYRNEAVSNDVACSGNSFKQKNLAEEDRHTVLGDDMINSSESKELKHEKSARVTKQDGFAVSDGVETPALFHEKKWAQIAYEEKLSSVVFGSVTSKVSECFPVSEITKNLEQGSMDAVEATEPFSENNRADAVNFDDSDLQEAMQCVNASSYPGVESICIDGSEHNSAVETIDAEDELKFQLHHADNGPDGNITLQKQTHRPFENLCKTFIAQSPKSVESIENEVETLAPETGHVEEAEGMDTCKNESPESATSNELDEAIAKPFGWETKYVDSVEKEFKTMHQQTGSIKGAAEGANNGEKESFKSNSKGDFGEAVESGLAVQSNLLVAVPEEGNSDGQDGKGEVCPIEVDPVHVIGSRNSGKDSRTSIGHLDMAEKRCSLKESSGKFLLRNSASALENDARNTMLTCLPLDEKSTCYSADFNAATCTIAFDSLQSLEENTCYGSLQNACSDDFEGLHSDYPTLLNDKDDEGVKVEADVEESDALPFKSSMPDEMTSQALVCEMHDGPGSNAKQNMAENINTRGMKLQGLTTSLFSVGNWKIEGAESNCEVDLDEQSGNVNSAVSMESLSFGHGENEKGDRDIEGALEYAPEEPFDSLMIAGNRTGLENDDEVQIDLHLDAAEDNTCSIGNNKSVRRSEEGGLPCDIAEKSVNSEAKLKFNANEGEKYINEDLADGNTNTMYQEACVTEGNRPVSEGFDNAESSNYAMQVTDSAPEHYVYRERSPAYNDDTQEVDSAKIPDVKNSQNDGDAEINSHEKSINSEADQEFNADEVYNNDPQEDSLECLGVRDTQDVIVKTGSSVDKEAPTLALMLPMTLDSLIAMPDVLGNTSSQTLVDVSGVHEMAQEVPRDYPSTLLNQVGDNRCGNIELILEVKNHIIHVDTGSNPPISENKGVNIEASEKIEVGYAVGGSIAFSNSMNEHGEIAAQHFFRSPGCEIGRDAMNYNASDNKVDVDSSSRCVNENFSHPLQEQNNTSLIPSYQRMDPTESACQPGMMTAVLFDDDDMKSNMESCVFTDSEIDLFWGETAKDEVTELKSEATDVTFSVNEYETENAENERLSTHQAAVEETMELQIFVEKKVAESGECLQLGDDMSEHKLQDSNGGEERCDHVDQVADNLGNVAEIGADMHQELGDDGEMGEQNFQDDNLREERDDNVDQIADEGNETSEKSANLGTDDKVLMSSLIERKNSRSILIHGTAKKQSLFNHDMKENTPAQKRLQKVNATAVKPNFKRKALGDLGK